MGKERRNIKQLYSDMEHVLNAAEHFLKDLKGQKHVKGLVRKDTEHLKAHLQRLIDHLSHLEDASAE